MWIIAILVAFSCCWGTVEGVQGKNFPFIEVAEADDSDADYRPGATNPVPNPGRFYLLKDDYLCTLFGNLGDHTLTKNWNVPKSSDLTDWKNKASTVLSEPDYGNGLNKGVISPTALATGRITSPDKDDVVGAFYYIDGNMVKPYVFFVDNPDVNTKATGAFPDNDFNEKTSYNDFYSIDIAVGDVDRKLNSDGEYNDEIVVVFRYMGPSNDARLYIAVLDKNLKRIDIQDVDSDLDYPTGNNNYTRPHISVAMGDYDNDGVCEIAVGYRTSESSGGDQKYAFEVYDVNNGGLDIAQTFEYKLSVDERSQYNVVDMTSGDFNGDGVDELAVCISGFQTEQASNAYNFVPYLMIFAANADNALTHRGTWHPSDSSSITYGSMRGAGIASGLFKLDPTGGFSTARREIAMVCIPGDSNYYVNVMTFEVNDDFNPSLKDSLFIYHYHSNELITYSQDNTCLPKITTGNFKGLDTDKVREQLAVSWSDTRQPKFAVFDLDENLTLSLKYQGDFHPGQPATSDQQFMSVSIAASDRDGKSYYLGSPIHLEVPRYLRANYVVQEPPKHLDYLPDDEGNWSIVRVSRTRRFYASFEDSEGTTFESTHETSTNFDIGASEQVTAKETISDGANNDGGGGVGFLHAALSLQESEKTAFDYDSVTSKLDGKYDSKTSSASYNADRDDYIQARFRVMDIWRFPIYGLKTKDDLNSFYEVVMPGPYTKILDTWGFDFSDYYQPLHENGNILSYPQTSDENFPEDLGSFTVCDANGENCQDFQSAMSEDNLVETYGSGGGTRSIQWEQDTWSTETKSHTYKLDFNADIQASFTATANEVLAKQKWYANIDVAFHTGKSWNTADFSKSTMSSSKGITLVLPSSGESNQSYTFKPELYATKDGTPETGPCRGSHRIDPGFLVAAALPRPAGSLPQSAREILLAILGHGSRLSGKLVLLPIPAGSKPHAAPVPSAQRTQERGYGKSFRGHLAHGGGYRLCADHGLQLQPGHRRGRLHGLLQLRGVQCEPEGRGSRV